MERLYARLRLTVRSAPHVSLSRSFHRHAAELSVSVLRPWAALYGFSWPPDATSASRASAGSDFDPVLFMIDARWFSTVRWLMPRSAAMFLLGWPASTRSITSRCRGVRPAR